MSSHEALSCSWTQVSFKANKYDIVINYTCLYLKHGWSLGSQSYKPGSHLLKTRFKVMLKDTRVTAKWTFPFQFRQIKFCFTIYLKKRPHWLKRTSSHLEYKNPRPEKKSAYGKQERGELETVDRRACWSASVMPCCCIFRSRRLQVRQCFFGEVIPFIRLTHIAQKKTRHASGHIRLLRSLCDQKLVWHPVPL